MFHYCFNDSLHEMSLSCPTTSTTNGQTAESSDGSSVGRIHSVVAFFNNTHESTLTLYSDEGKINTYLQIYKCRHANSGWDLQSFPFGILKCVNSKKNKTKPTQLWNIFRMRECLACLRTTVVAHK